MKSEPKILLMKHYHLPVFIASLLWLASCAPSYLPNNANMPLLAEKQDYAIGANLQLGAGLGPEVQAAYALTNHIGLVANGHANFAEEGDYSLFGELGGGLFTVLGDRFHLELYNGIGLGSGKGSGSTLFGGPIDEEGDYWRYYVQPNIGFRTGGFEIALGARFAYVDYYEFIRNGTPGPTPDAWLWEPSAALRFGGGRGFFEHNRIFLQGIHTRTFSPDPGFDRTELVLGLGLLFRY
jgi:hypothetical protein